MRHRFTALLTAAMLLVVIVAPAQARDPQQTRHQQIVAYWTAERMAAAIPRDFVFDKARGFTERGKPGGGGSGGTTTGASWNGGGDIKERTGKVYFTMGASNYVCSGAVAADTRTTTSLVLTAAHCAYDETAGAFATNWTFIPDFDQSPTFTCSQTEYGCWTSQALVVHQGYASAGSFNTQATLHDFAFAVVGPGGHGSTQLDTEVGAFSVAVPGFTLPGQTSYAFGYPAAQKYKGNDLVYCNGAIFEDPYNDELTWGLPCNMTGGSSGGPWLWNFSASSGSGALSSVNSYGYSGVTAMHGPKFNADTTDVYNAAKSATSNTIVP